MKISLHSKDILNHIDHIIEHFFGSLLGGINSRLGSDCSGFTKL